MRKTIVIRYTLLPYLYTLFYHVHENGGTVVRSLAHEFPKNKRTYDIDEQFLWGGSLLISPVIYQGKTIVDVFLPQEARWYSYYDGKEATAGLNKIFAPRDFIPLHVRGGSILPTQDSGKNTDESRKNPFGLIIAPDEAETAQGTLYWDDGESYDAITTKKYNLYEFSFSRVGGESVIDIKITNQGYPITNRLNKIRLFDVKFAPTQFLIDSVVQVVNFTYDNYFESLEIENLNLSMSGNHKIQIRF
jgi:alpha-glucosidase (family GH31 glycosyl hydrolase)